MTLKSGLPAMYAPGHMAIRYAGASLTAIDSLWQPNEVHKESKDGAISVFSFGPAFDEGLLDLTISQQPVFHFWEPRYDEITGIAASSLSGSLGYETYWFAPPPAATVPAKGFTAWLPPRSIENAAWQATHAWNVKTNERGFPVTDASALPRIRYHLITLHEAHRLDEPWKALRSWLPGLIRQQHSVDVAPSDPTARGRVDLIRPRDVVIPACD